jgi:membrane protein involved in colicin uptake
MPWCATEDDCLLAYYTLYRPTDRHQTKIERLRAAKTWDASVRTKDFVTWTDVPMQQQHTQKQAAEAAKAAVAADALVMAEARTKAANEAQRKAEAATSALDKATARFEAAQANSGKGKRGQKRSRYTYALTHADTRTPMHISYLLHTV